MTDARARLIVLERRCRLLIVVQCGMTLVMAVAFFGAMAGVSLTAQSDKLTTSELTVVDAKGTVRVRIGGNLPNAVIDGKPVPRGGQAAGLLLYDDTGAERSGYVTFASPNRYAVLTLDNARKQTALFAAGPEGGSALRLWYEDNAVELSVGRDGPVIHATQGKRPVFHEPPVQNPEKTEMCQELRQARGKFSDAQLLETCLNRSSEAACGACLGKK